MFTCGLHAYKTSDPEAMCEHLHLKHGAAPTVRRVGRKGGTSLRDQRGTSYYEEIGRKGVRKLRELIAAGKRELGESP